MEGSNENNSQIGYRPGLVLVGDVLVSPGYGASAQWRIKVQRVQMESFTNQPLIAIPDLDGVS